MPDLKRMDPSSRAVTRPACWARASADASTQAARCTDDLPGPFQAPISAASATGFSVGAPFGGSVTGAGATCEPIREAPFGTRLP